MVDAVNILLGIFQDAWGVIVFLIGVFVVLGLTVIVLKGTVAQALGSNIFVTQAVLSALGLLLFVLMAFYAIPAIVKSITISTPNCGPITDLGNAAALAIGAVGAMRMLYSTFRGVAMTAVGAPAGISQSAFEIGLVLFGMLAASAIVPIVTAFLGGC